jgi:hypothetical protein
MREAFQSSRVNSAQGDFDSRQKVERFRRGQHLQRRRFHGDWRSLSLFASI